VLFDDRDLRAGEKFADAELIGIPTRLVVSEKTMAQGGVEVTDRKTGTSSFLADSKVIEHLTE
jgi:prolyl-tRNA synthetase